MKHFFTLSSVLLTALLACCCSGVDHGSAEGIALSYLDALDAGDIDKQAQCFDVGTNRLYSSEEELKTKLKASRDNEYTKKAQFDDVGHYKNCKFIKKSSRYNYGDNREEWDVHLTYYDPVRSENRKCIICTYQSGGKWYVTGDKGSSM